MPQKLATQQLWAYNQYLIDQAQDMLRAVALHAPQTPRFAQAIGPHLRHIIEHYDALMRPLQQQADKTPAISAQNHDASSSLVIDYDTRARDKSLETSLALAQERLLRLRAQMQALGEGAQHTQLQMALPLQVKLQAGGMGEQFFITPSTLGRELLFVASHTIHHFALLRHYCVEIGVELSADFGKAPSTLAFEKSNPASPD